MKLAIILSTRHSRTRLRTPLGRSFCSSLPLRRAFHENDRKNEENHNFDYDLAVIGGGSGGLACSQEAANFGKKVILFDYVTPSPQNTKWGLGGTCVNVGCIPKKLMHQASLLGEAMQDASKYGWQLDPSVPHQWEPLRTGVQNYIKSMNWGYRVKLREAKVNYVNALASFSSPHTLRYTDRTKEEKEISARRILIAVGGRPRYLDIPGKEFAITSDDLWSLPQSPGKTLVVGASYVALESAGFLTGLGHETTVMGRGTFLRSFDQQMATLIVDHMESHGTRFVYPAVPFRIEKVGEKALRVFWRDSATGTESSEMFETVLFAVGREPLTRQLGLETAGVEVGPTGKVSVAEEQTSVPHIYAVGDIVEGMPELTPVAISAGKLLARRLYGGGTHTLKSSQIPTTVFTPLEYSSCGWTEEEAKERLGENGMEVFHAHFQPLEWTVAGREANRCYVKLVVDLSSGKVVGLHLLGPHAGEIMQGFAVAMRCGVTKEQLDLTVGIHPTVAEELTNLDITKRSGKDPVKTGC